MNFTASPESERTEPKVQKIEFHLNFRERVALSN